MDENKTNTGGKRLKKRRGSVVVLSVVCACLVLAAVGAYLGLCSWSTGRVLPNSVAQGLRLEGLERGQAYLRLEEITDRYAGMTIDLIYGNTMVLFEADKADISFNINAVLDQVTMDGPFLSRGMTWLQATFSKKGIIAEQPMLFAKPLYFDGLATELNRLLTYPVQQHTILTDENTIEVRRGWAGQAIHTEGLEQTLLEKVLAEDSSPLMLDATITEPKPIDFQPLYHRTFIPPSNAYLNKNTLEIVPHITGVSIPLEDMNKQFEQTAPGGHFTVEWVYTEPEITTELLTEVLFIDKLGEAYSKVNGTADRLSNVELASSMCNDYILLPGEEFSYWSMIAPCTKEQGFKDAPTYLYGQTVPGVGGGICQVSSNIYTAVLQANLEIIQRNPHSYIPQYLPNGSDAMVNGGSSDFKFKNNTPFPILIRAAVKDRGLTVELWGTKTDDTYVVMEHNDISSTPWTTQYQIDPTVPKGKPKELTTPYTGYKTESYRCIYDAEGNLLSRTLESISNYRKRDRVLAINPADAAKYNVDPITGEKLPNPKPSP